jgi:ATP-binding cassette subfamily B protein
MADPAPRPALRLHDLPAMARNAVRTVRLVDGAHKALLRVLVALQLADALTAVAIAWVGRHIVDAVVAAAQSSASAEAAWRWVAVELVLVALRAAVTQGATYAGAEMRSRLSLTINQSILEKAANVAYTRFEDPDFLNLLTQARREASARPLDVVNQLLAMARHASTLAGYVALLWALGPWALAVMVLSALPTFWAEAKHGQDFFGMLRRRTTRQRQAFYYESILTQEATVKEVKLLSLGHWVVGRYREVHQAFHDEEMVLHRARARATFVLGLLSTAAFYGAYAVIVQRAVAGAFTLGAMTLYLLVLRQGQQSLQGLLSAVARIYESDLYMSNLYSFLAEPEAEPDLPIPPDYAPPAQAPVVRFEGVSYRYPGADRDVLHDVSFTLQSGEAVALVGRNGAGKTTLVKLLVGLYQPTAGRVTVDGVDVKELGLDELRRRIGVVFQDFARFQFRVGDNIGIGWLPSLDDADAVDRAVQDAGAGEVIKRLPKGLDTTLGRAFGGDDLSVGQWQRVALARAFMRRSRMLVLDEPTAAMDAEAEHDVFLRLKELRAGRTALLITHRFSTVRMADRVVVLDGGRIAEEGTHRELLAQGGLYAKMFNLQAQGYRDA